MNTVNNLKENITQRANYFEKLDKQTFSYSITNYYITPIQIREMFKQLLNDEVIDNWRLNSDLTINVGYPKVKK